MNLGEYNDVIFVPEKSLERLEMVVLLLMCTTISIKKVVQLCLKQSRSVLLVTRMWKENSIEEGTVK